MKKKIMTFVLLAAFILLLGGSYVLYNRLSANMERDSLVTNKAPATEAETAVGTDTEEAVGTHDTGAEVPEEPQLTPAPDFTVYDTEGNAVSLSDFAGKPVIVNFWASWCGPCKSEMPAFEDAFVEYGDEIQFLMVNMTDGNRETVEKASKFIEDQGYTFPVYFDTDIDAAMTYGVSSIPTTFLIDADGNIAAYAMGAINAEALLKESGLFFLRNKIGNATGGNLSSRPLLLLFLFLFHYRSSVSLKGTLEAYCVLSLL